MNWLSDFVRPKIKALIQRDNEIPADLWTKCTKCEHMLFQSDLKKQLLVCHHCNQHMRMGAVARIKSLFDDEQYSKLEIPKVPLDPLKFKDSKKYVDRLKDSKSKTQLDDAIIAGYGDLEKIKVVIAAFDFSFMGGSMGMAVGQGIVAAANWAVKTHSPLIVIPSSGGARMQEGILSLMQMPRTVVAVNMVKNAGLPYINVLSDPTTGGVSASFAMLGDITIAEPGSLIGFTGARVIEENIRQKLPEGFQKAEYLLEHGMVDMVVHRHDLKSKLAQLLRLITKVK